MQVGRWVWALLGTACDAFGCPWGIIHVHFSAMIVEHLKVGACLVENVFDVISQVGQSSHLVYKLFPGGGICRQLDRLLTNLPRWSWYNCSSTTRALGVQDTAVCLVACFPKGRPPGTCTLVAGLCRCVFGVFMVCLVFGCSLSMYHTVKRPQSGPGQIGTEGGPIGQW